MCNKLVNLVKDLDIEMTMASKAVLWALADRCNTKTHRCDPSHERIARDISSNRMTVIRNVKSLERKGLISVVRRKGGHSSNVYSFHLEKFDQMKSDVNHIHTSSDERDVTESHTSSDKTGVTLGLTDAALSTKRCNSEPERCNRESQETKETNLNQKKPTNESLSNGQSDFEKWWDGYPKEGDQSMACHDPSVLGNKEKAARIWNQLQPAFDLLIADVEKRKANDWKWLRGYAPLPENYLKKETWKQPIEPMSNSDADSSTGLPRDDNQLEDWAVENGVHERGKAPSYIQNKFEYRQYLTQWLKDEKFDAEAGPTPTRTIGSTNDAVPACVEGPFKVEQVMKNMAAKKTIGR